MARIRKQAEPSPLLQDIAGVGLFAFGAVLLVGMVTAHSGRFGEVVGAVLKTTVGLGAFVVPALLMFAGGILLVGMRRTGSTSPIVGFVIFFVVFVTWCQFLHTPSLNELIAQEKLAAADLQRGGGYLGLGFAYVLEWAFGRVSSYILLAGAAIVSVLLVTGVPLMAIVGPVVKWGRGGFQKTRRMQGYDARRGGETFAERESAENAKPEPLAIIKRRILSNRDEDAGGRAKAEATAVVKMPEGPSSDAAAGPLAARSDSEFCLPPVTLLKEPPPAPKRAQAELNYKIDIIEQTLEEFKIEADVVEVSHGPTVTRYEIQLAPGIKVSKIVSLADNLAMALAAIDVRVEAPIPGKSAIGVEVPNSNPAVVTLREAIDTEQFWNAPSKLVFALGKDVAGQARFADLTKMPHLLIAGATNAGKSVCLNSLISSLLFRSTPREVKFILIDPKRVELSLFDGIPHLCTPVVRDVRQAAGILRASLKEMEHRYDLFVQTGTRNFDSYNAKVKPEQRLPYIVIVVDELADLMMQAAPEVEFAVCRLAQLARATGIHLVIATQRPSVDVVTGTIKANISSRLAFAMSSQVDSRTILDMGGAERLIGCGDMLFKPIDSSKPARIQGCLISEKEIESLVAYLKEQESPEYTMQPAQIGDVVMGAEDGTADEMYEPAVRLVIANGHASTSMLQRRFKIGYTRAARLVDAMEGQGIVGALDGAKPREVLVAKEDVDRLFEKVMFAEVGDEADTEYEGDEQEDV